MKLLQRQRELRTPLLERLRDEVEHSLDTARAAYEHHSTMSVRDDALSPFHLIMVTHYAAMSNELCELRGDIDTELWARRDYDEQYPTDHPTDQLDYPWNQPPEA